jgi:predicted nucleotidyltransferase
MTKKSILKDLYDFNSAHKDEGFTLISLFGLYARGTEDIFSDIDITYKINHDIFFKDNAFAKLERIEDIKKELENNFHKKVDLIPVNTKNHLIQKTLEKEQIII